MLVHNFTCQYCLNNHLAPHSSSYPQLHRLDPIFVPTQTKFQIAKITHDPGNRGKTQIDWRRKGKSRIYTVEILHIYYKSIFKCTCINRCSEQHPPAPQVQEVLRAGWLHTGARAHCQWSGGGSTATGSGYECSLHHTWGNYYPYLHFAGFSV